MNQKIISIILSISILFTFLMANSGFTNAAMIEDIISEDYSSSGKYWSDPAIVMKYNEKLASTLIDTNLPSEYATETYDKTSRIFQAMPTIEKVGDRIWTAWMTGDKWETGKNYIVMGYSDDGGNTWVEPYLIIDHPDRNNQGIAPIIPNLWRDPEGNMWLFYQQYGTWAIKFNNAHAENINDVTWQDPRLLISGWGASKAPIVVDNKGREEWIFVTEKQSIEKMSNPIFSSFDKGATWSRKGNAETQARTKWSEANVVHTGEELWVLGRLEMAGGLERAISNDFGESFSPFEQNMHSPLTSCGTKIHIEKLPSGNMIIVNNDSLTRRENMTIWLSEDNGKTWPYKLLLDSRCETSYPEASYHNGKIYIIYDFDRGSNDYTPNGAMDIRMAVISEDDIKAGKLVTDESRLKVVVSKLGPFKDIVRLKTQLKTEIIVNLDQSAQDIIEGLPASISAVDEDGNEHTLTGEWKAPISFKTGKIGTYQFNFDTDLGDVIRDTYDYLKVTVIVQKSDDGGCGSLIATDIENIIILFSVAAILLMFVFKRYNFRGDKT